MDGFYVLKRWGDGSHGHDVVDGGWFASREAGKGRGAVDLLGFDRFSQAVVKIRADRLQAHHPDVAAVPWRIVAPTVAHPQDRLREGAGVFECEPDISLLRENDSRPCQRRGAVDEHHQILV